MSQVVSELQQEIYSTYTFPSMRMSIRPSDLIFYNVLEELPVDDPRLDPQCIALYCQNEGTSLKNTLETFFEVRQCAPTESVSLIQRSGNVNDLKNINVLIQISGYEIQTSSSYSGTLVSSPFPQNNPREHANQKPPEFQLPAIGLDSNAPAGTDFPSADRVLLDEMEIAVMNEVGTDHGINPRVLIFGDPPEQSFSLNSEQFPRISDIQREILKNFVPFQKQIQIQPENLIVYKVLEPLATDDTRLRLDNISIGYLMHGSNTVERMFLVRKCEPLEVTGADFADMDGVGMRIALLAFVPGYYEYSFPGVPNFIQPQNLIPQFPSTSAEWQPAAINIERSTSSPSLNGGRNSPVPSTAREHICNWTAPSQPVCGIICDSGKALLSHIDQKHIGYSKTNDLCLKCFWPGCNYEAEKKRHHIISHLKVHVRDADFECEICGRRYKRSNELNFHKKAHHANFLTRTLSKNRRLSVEAGISSADLPENLDSNSKLSMEMALRNNSTVAIPAHQANDIIQQLLSESAISPQLIYKNSFESSLNPNWIFGNGNIGIDYSSQLPDPLHEHVQEETNNIDQYFDMAKFESSSMEPSNEFYGENTFALLHQKRSHQRPPPEILSSLAVAPAVLLKLVVVGDPGSGKTSLVRRMDNDVYNPSDIPQVWEKCTIERLRHNKNVEIEMVDTTSEQNYNRFRVLSYTNSDAVILTFSIVYPESLENVVDKWAGEVRHFCGSTPIFLVGCKVDLRENILDPNNVVSKEKGFEYAQRIGASAYFEVSSKSGEGINDLVSGFENVKKRSPIADGRRAKQKCSIL